MAFFEFGYLVELGGYYSEVGLGLVFGGRLAEFGVEEEGEQGKGDDVGVIVSSLSSVFWKVVVAIPALMMTASRRGRSRLTRSEKARTDA